MNDTDENLTSGARTGDHSSDSELGFDILAEADAANNVSSGSYQVLARKYRPQNFEDMIGQEAMVQTLRNAFDSGRIAHAFMLTGVRGVGKTTTARILARALNFQSAAVSQPTTQLADYGEHCQAIMEGRHVDVMEMDAASRTGIGDIREIIEGVRYGPAAARYKVYIIDEVHMLSTAAFNGLLKTLEEPPPYVKFIFATTEIRKVPVTVLSRCQRFDLRRLTLDDTINLLDRVCAAEKTSLGSEAKGLIARAAEGSARDALSLLDRALAHAGEDAAQLDGDTMRQLLGLADRGRIFDLFETLMRADVVAALEEFSTQYNLGADPALIIADLADITYWITRLKFIDDADQDVTVAAEQRRRGREMADNLSMRHLARCWQALTKGHQEVLSANNPRAAAEMVLMRLAHLADLPTPDELIQALDKTKNEASTSGPTSTAGPSPQGKAPRGQISGHSTLTALAPQPLETPALANFQAVLELVAEKRDIGLKHALETDIHLISFSPPIGQKAGRIEMRLAEGAPNIAQELTTKLRKWTGQNWVITLSGTGGAQTIASRREDARLAQYSAAKGDPLVKAALEAFPDAEIISIQELLASALDVEEED